MNLLQPVYTSLLTSASATLICILIGLPAGYGIAVSRFPGRQMLITLLNTALALPTVIVGLIVYSLLSRHTPLGELHFLFTVPAIIIGQAFLGLPIMTALTISAVSAISPAAAETARMLGASRSRVTLTILQEARFTLMAAVTATFGRLIGEIGVSLMVGGNIAGCTRTMTTAIALETSKGEFEYALQLGGILLVLALAVNLLMRLIQGKGPK